MKKPLAQNISRYDNKMLFRLDKRTGKALLVSVLFGLIVCIILGLFLSLIYSISFAVMAGLLMLLAQIVEVEGVPFAKMILQSFFTPIIKRQYEHTASHTYDRLSIDISQERSDTNEKER